MDARQFKRAEEHREACREKFTALVQAPDFLIAARRWSEFLVEHQRWFTRMQQAFGRGPSSAWFGKLKARRKADPLLSYLHHARHADEHGLERIAQGQPSGAAIGVGGGRVYIERLEIQDGIITHLSGTQNNGSLQVHLSEAHLKLNRVQNRGVFYNPPICSELGEPYSAIRAADECLNEMQIASESARNFFS